MYKKWAFLFAKNCTSLFADFGTFLFAEKCTLLFTVYIAAPNTRIIKNSYLWHMDIIERNIDTLINLCKQHKVKELYIFGSVLTSKFNDNSDIDFLVQFDNVDILEYADNYFDFKEKLENLLGREIDLLENQAIRNPIFRKVLDREKRLVYDRETA